VAPNAGMPFALADVEALQSEFPVELIALDQFPSKLHLAFEVFRRSARREVAAILLWLLAPAYSLEVMAIARVYRIPVVVMTGGLDIDYVPELELGGLRWPHNRLRQKIALRRADLVLAMSDFSADRIRALAAPRRLEVVHMGVDVESFYPGGRKEPLVVTVCWSITAETARLKGITTVVAAAALLPDVAFLVIGRSGGDRELARLQGVATANVTFIDGFIPAGRLLELFQRAKVYAQVSAHEGFGVAAAEAMACGAIVVGAGAHGLREVVGETGIFVPYGDAPATAGAIRDALGLDEEAERAARLRIVEHFTFARRQARLVESLRPLIDRSAGRQAPLVQQPRADGRR
jgi:glycosyltransferase involved in cell wall biosynthesis